MSLATLTINFTGPAQSPADTYWLTVVDTAADDIATEADVGAVLDALYDIDPCVEAETVPEEKEITPAAVTRAFVSKLSLEECRLLRSGTYTAELKITRSHVALPYKLVLSVGTAAPAVVVRETTRLTLNVQRATSVVLETPVISGFRASWRGRVIGAQGSVAPPQINLATNTLYWDEPVTGTIACSFLTEYDLVTVTIPGVPGAVAGIGEPQDCALLAFYQYMVISETISPPKRDANAPTIAELCGAALDSGETGEDDPLPAPPPEPKDPCDHRPENWTSTYDLLYLDDPRFYADTCCKPGRSTTGSCGSWTKQKPLGKGLSAETKDYYNSLTEWNENGIVSQVGRVEFIAVGPDPASPDGCGQEYYEVDSRPKDCCQEVVALAWDYEGSVEVMADNSQGMIRATGGIGPYTFSSPDNQLYFLVQGVRVQSITTLYPYAIVNSGNICGSITILVQDQCSVASGDIRAVDGRWERVYGMTRCVSGLMTTQLGSGWNVYTTIGGKYKQVQWVFINGSYLDYYIYGTLDCGACAGSGENQLELPNQPSHVPECAFDVPVCSPAEWHVICLGSYPSWNLDFVACRKTSTCVFDNLYYQWVC